jgi:hypothetical protein
MANTPTCRRCDTLLMLQETDEVFIPRRFKEVAVNCYCSKLRTAPVAIQRPRAPLGLKIRINNKGLPQLGKLPSVPVNCVFPCPSSVKAGVLWSDWLLALGLHARVPRTFVTGPGVPLNPLPFMTSPSTWKVTAVIRQNSTRVPTQANRTNNSSVDPAIALRRIEEEGRSDSDQHYTASHLR